MPSDEVCGKAASVADFSVLVHVPLFLVTLELVLFLLVPNWKDIVVRLTLRCLPLLHWSVDWSPRRGTLMGSSSDGRVANSGNLCLGTRVLAGPDSRGPHIEGGD